MSEMTPDFSKSKSALAQLSPAGGPASSLANKYRTTRALTQALIAGLSDADATLQSMEDASPAKWHLAHTNWFFETFLLRDHHPSYRLYNQDWPFLFNSYYEAEGARIARFARGMLSRPLLAEILEWRAHVDQAMGLLIDDPALADLIQLGIAHEQQHQELLLTDIKHALFQNPLGPVMWDEPAGAAKNVNAAPKWHKHSGGIEMIGHPQDGGFAFDNEGPRHQVLLEPFAMAGALVTNGHWADFIADGGYQKCALWLADGWAQMHNGGGPRAQLNTPLYWHEDQQFTHSGWQTRDPDAPVTHISYFEADAFATGRARVCRQNMNGKRSPKIMIQPRATSLIAQNPRFRAGGRICLAIAGNSPVLPICLFPVLNLLRVQLGNIMASSCLASSC